MRLVRKPFKGNTFFEWQIGPLVIQVRHTDNPHFGRVHVWRDKFWR